MVTERTSAKTEKQKQPWLWFAMAAVLIGLVCLLSFLTLRQELYEERAYNSQRVMNKICANIQTVMKTQEDHVTFSAALIADRGLAEDADAAAFLGKLEAMGTTEEGADILLLIDSDGNCLASDGLVFRWGESGTLHANQPQILVSSMNALGLSDENLLFLVPLPRPVATVDRTFTHICLVMGQDVIARYLANASYVENSAIFIIQDNGTYIYKQAEGSAFSGVFNLIAKLESWEYLYETTADKAIADIHAGIPGCACITLNGESYFVVYEALGVNGWTAVYILPEEGASGNSSNFMGAVILTVTLLAAVVMATVLGFILAAHERSMRQQKLVNERLQQAAEAERSANNAKTRFLSSMSHDIRTPMNAIIGMTAIAKSHIDDPGYVRDCLIKIQLAGDHLLTLINDILDISKIESGRMSLSPVVFSLADSIDSLFNIVRPQASAKNQKFTIHVEALEQEYLLADELRLNQIFINILTNAVKYTPENGEIAASIRETASPDRPGFIDLSYVVRDNGIGMTPEFMAEMYGSFSRATDSRVNKIQGSGLGLAICKQLVEMMDGSITCESAVGVGTTFTVLLTLQAAGRATGDYRLPGLRVLLVDDDEAHLKTTRALFEEMDAQVTCARSGAEALALVKERRSPCSVVMMDWQMPGLDGIEAMRQLHQVDAALPVILVSAYDSTDLEQAAIDAGAIGFLHKPFFKAALHEELTQYLDLSQLPEHALPPGGEDDLAGMRVLVAEDNDLNWEIASELLDMAGIACERVVNGALCVERLEAAADGEFDAVLMDIQMPVMNGREATRRIRELGRPYLSSLPVIAMTADAFAEDIAACMDAGMNGHIPKPIDVDKLYAELKKIRQASRPSGKIQEERQQR